ncbi:hypothetical protein [Capnocytophaga leadbetteri]|uniref:hypothetical protein n=1 Tax=Capnocytophaga leadbetteri TaxID=327575 RepID=UPI0028D6CF05|nr:hypothetical protein [Capnocytophaga leadbetteri]
MRDQKNDHILYTVSISASLLSACYLAKNISNKTAITNNPENTAITNNPENTALTNKPENTPLPHVEKIIYIEKEEYNKSSDNILKELGNVALLFSIVLLFLLLLYLALYFSKK